MLTSRFDIRTLATAAVALPVSSLTVSAASPQALQAALAQATSGRQTIMREISAPAGV